MPLSLSEAESVARNLESQNLRALTAAALDGAKSAGAMYADVHFRDIRSETWSIADVARLRPLLYTNTGFSVRALVNGYWGFAAIDGVVTSDVAVQMGRTAASQARISAATGKIYSADLSPLPVVANGSWTTPIKIDPFSISFEEKAEFFTVMCDYVQCLQYGVAAAGSMAFQKEERTFASSEGSYTTQTLHSVDGDLGITVLADWATEEIGSLGAAFLSTASGGWEYIRDNPYQENVQGMIREALRSRRKKPVEVGRYDVVFDAEAASDLIGKTIGSATGLDRAFGYEANDVGTSYINEPIEMLGTFKMGSALFSVTANRSMPGGAANVKWDAEGAEPTETVLVKNGILNDFQTTRESANWIADYYKKNNVPVRSAGCAGQYTPTTPVTQVQANLVMGAGKDNTSFDDLIKDTKKGLAVIGGRCNMDYQVRNGTGTGHIVYEIVNGKLGSTIRGAQYVFRAPDLWNNLVGIGGQDSAIPFGLSTSRNNTGRLSYTVSAVPAKITGVAVTDMGSK